MALLSNRSADARRGSASGTWSSSSSSSSSAKAKRRRVGALLAAIAAAPVMSLLSPGGASAATTVYWDIDGATPGAGGATPAGNWSGVDANWNALPDGSGAVAPWVDGDTAIFAAGSDATGDYTVTVGGAPSVAGINVEEGGTITVAGGSLDTNAGAGTAIDTATGTTLTVTSVISGAGRITKNGGGRLNLGTALNQANTFTGGLTLNGGLTVFPGENNAAAGNPNPLGAAPASVIADYLIIQNGATLRSTRNSVGGSFVIPNRGITLNAGGAVFDVENAAAELLYTGKITGVGGFVKVGAGQLRLQSTTNDFAGDIQVQQGTLGIGSSTTVIGTGTLRLQGGNMMYHAARTLSNPLSVEADVTFSNTTGATSGARSMSFSSNSISGTAGTVRIRNIAAVAAPIAVLRFTGGGFDFGRPIVIGDATDLGLSRLEFLTDAPTAPQTFSGLISGPGVLRRTNNVLDQGGDTILTQANTYTGGTEINGGFVGVGADECLGTGGIILGSPASTDDTTGFFAVGGPRTLSNNITMGTQTNIRIKGDESLTLAGTIDLAAASNRTFTTNGNGATTFSNTISGEGSNLIKAGIGSLTLSGSNTYTGATMVNAGELVFGASQNSSPNLTVANDAFVEVATTATGTTVVKTGTVVLNGNAKLNLTTNKLVTADALGTWDGVSAYTGVSGLVDAGRGNASNAQWDGSGIVTSDTRAVNNNDLVSIGTAKVGAIRNIADGDTTTFAGQTVLGSDTIAMVTWGGDANLDGKINIDDYGQIDFNVGSSGSVFGWFNGDFNYDGKINIDDYGIIDFNVSAQNFVFTTSGGAASAALDGVASVPEPASLSLVTLGVATSLLRRRRRA